MVEPPEAGDKYYVMARYDNGLIEPDDVKGANGRIQSMKIPYKSGDTQNIVSYDDGTIVYDKILSTTDIEGANKMLIKYAKGITSGGTEQQSGIHYEETLYYNNKKHRNCPMLCIKNHTFDIHIDHSSFQLYIYISLQHQQCISYDKNQNL
jgi:hypothetical protein